MPEPKKPLSKAQRRKLVATEVVTSGRKLAHIAQQVGVTRATISADYNAPETQDYIQRLLAKRDERLEALVDKSLTAIEGGLTALKSDSEDHQVRMRAVAETARILNLRAGRSDGDSSDGNRPKWSGTFEQLLIDYRTITAQVGEAEPAA